MAQKMDKHELRELRERVQALEATWSALPSWTQEYQIKGELLLSLKKQLREQEEGDGDLAKAPPPLEFRRGDVQSELAAIDKRLAVLGDGPLTEVYVAHRQELKARRDHINERLPYVEVSDDDLATQIEDARIEMENLNAQISKMPKLTNSAMDSPSAKKAHRLFDEAAERLSLLSNEQTYRFDHRDAQQAVETLAQNQAKQLATNAMRESLETQQKEMLAQGRPKWEIRKLIDESVGQEPPAEMVETLANDIRQDWIDRHPVADPSVAI